MSEITTSPLTEEVDEDEDDTQAVFEIVYFRVVSTDEEWEADEASQRYDLSREEAATRLDNEDYSPLS